MRKYRSFAKQGASLPPDVRYAFKHALVQDTAYESLLRSRRQILHRKIAETPYANRSSSRMPRWRSNSPQLNML